MALFFQPQGPIFRSMETRRQSVTVTINYFGELQKFELRRGLGFQAACARHKTPLAFDCRKADCGICIFKVLDGAENLSPAESAETDFLTAMRADPDERLACQTRIMGDVRIVVEY